jgi:signal transduction histidine kinase
VDHGAQDFLFKNHLDAYWVAQCIRHAIGRFHLTKRLKIAEKRELEAAQKASKAKTDFLTAMTHEIRTPISSILMAAEYLTKNQVPSQNKNEPNFAQIIHRSGKHLLTLINDILDLSKVEAGCLSIDEMILPLKATIEDVVSGFKILAEKKNLSLDLEFAEDLPKAFTTDVTRFNQILSNLLSNAIKFTEKGGIKIKSSLNGKKASEGLILEIIDSGIGISEQQINSLFRAYSQADNSIQHKFGGTGLGLILSKKLALAMGGDLELSTSSPGKGSTFTLSLPLRSPPKTNFGNLSLEE